MLLGEEFILECLEFELVKEGHLEGLAALVLELGTSEADQAQDRVFLQLLPLLRLLHLLVVLGQQRVGLSLQHVVAVLLHQQSRPHSEVIRYLSLALHLYINKIY